MIKYSVIQKHILGTYYKPGNVLTTRDTELDNITLISDSVIFQQIFIEHLLRASHCLGSGDLSKQTKRLPSWSLHSSGRDGQVSDTCVICQW